MNTDSVTIVSLDPAGVQILEGVTVQRERKTTVTEKGVLTADIIHCFADRMSLQVSQGDRLIEGAYALDITDRRKLLKEIDRLQGREIRSVIDYSNRSVLPHIEITCEA